MNSAEMHELRVTGTRAADPPPIARVFRRAARASLIAVARPRLAHLNGRPVDSGALVGNLERFFLGATVKKEKAANHFLGRTLRRARAAGRVHGHFS